MPSRLRPSLLPLLLLLLLCVLVLIAHCVDLSTATEIVDDAAAAIPETKGFDPIVAFKNLAMGCYGEQCTQETIATVAIVLFVVFFIGIPSVVSAIFFVFVFVFIIVVWITIFYRAITGKMVVYTRHPYALGTLGAPPTPTPTPAKSETTSVEIPLKTAEPPPTSKPEVVRLVFRFPKVRPGAADVLVDCARYAPISNAFQQFCNTTGLSNSDQFAFFTRGPSQDLIQINLTSSLDQLNLADMAVIEVEPSNTYLHQPYAYPAQYPPPPGNFGVTPLV